MSIDLPKSIALYFAVDQGDGDAIARCFTEDAVVKDEGHSYLGRDAIRRWKTDVSGKYKYTSEPFAIDDRDGKIVVTSHLVGDFPGSPIDLRYFFVLKDDRIASLEIKP
jgi:hypothetical protein